MRTCRTCCMVLNKELSWSPLLVTGVFYDVVCLHLFSGLLCSTPPPQWVAGWFRMAEQPLWEQIGSSFVQHYYQMFDNDRSQLGSIYVGWKNYILSPLCSNCISIKKILPKPFWVMWRSLLRFSSDRHVMPYMGGTAVPRKNIDRRETRCEFLVVYCCSETHC